jgi:hypothetical protein
MANIFRNLNFNRILLPIVLSSFTITYTIPLPAQQLNFNFNEVAFMVRLEKLVEKLVNSKDKSTESMVSYFVDIKQEVEMNYNINFNIDQYINRVQQEVQKKGVKPNKKHFDTIRKIIKKKDVKAKKHAHYVARTMYLEDYQMNELDEEMMTLAARSKHDHDKDKHNEEEKEEVVLPALLVYGVTVSLCGMLLMIIPIPACKDWGTKMVVAGVTACANSICSKKDENEKNKNKK